MGKLLKELDKKIEQYVLDDLINRATGIAKSTKMVEDNKRQVLKGLDMEIFKNDQLIKETDDFKKGLSLRGVRIGLRKAKQIIEDEI